MVIERINHHLFIHCQRGNSVRHTRHRFANNFTVFSLVVCGTTLTQKTGTSSWRWLFPDLCRSRFATLVSFFNWSILRDATRHFDLIHCIALKSRRYQYLRIEMINSQYFVRLEDKNEKNNSMIHKTHRYKCKCEYKRKDGDKVEFDDSSTLNEIINASGDTTEGTRITSFEMDCSSVCLRGGECCKAKETTRKQAWTRFMASGSRMSRSC